MTPFFGRVDVYEFALAATDEPIRRVRQRVWRFNQDIRCYGPGETIGEIQKVFASVTRRAAYLLYDRNGEEVARVDGRAPAALVRRHAGRVAVAVLGGVAGLVGLTFLGPPGLVGVASLVAVTGARELRGRLDPVEAVSVFDITRAGERLGTQRRRPPSRDPGDMLSTTLLGPTVVFDVDMSLDRARTVDRRLILALPVALDALRELVTESALR